MKTRIVVTGGRRYGKIPDWNRDPVPSFNEKVGNDWVSVENPEYIAACNKAGAERATLRRVLDSWREYQGGIEIAHGGAPGADRLAGEWAKLNGVDSRVYEADWRGLGAQAGPVRNRKMIEEFDPHFVIAFPGGRGTESTIRFALQRRIPVVRVKETR